MSDSTEVKEKKSWMTTIILILVNLYPIYGVVSLGWNIGQILFLFWIETVIIGFFNVLKLAFNQNHNTSEVLINGKPFTGTLKQLKLLLGITFVIHYGLFNLVHYGFLHLFFFRKYFKDVDLNSLFISILLIFLSHLFSLIYNYFIQKEYKNLLAEKLFFAPYKRIFIMHIFLIVGGFAVGHILNQYVNNYSLYVFIGVKILMDVVLHNSEHKKIK